MATPDPCAALFGSVKQACEDTGKLVNGTSGSSGGSLFSSIFGGVGTGFDFRHFMLRVAEFGIGISLVAIAAHALIVAEVLPSPIVKSAKKVGKKVAG